MKNLFSILATPVIILSTITNSGCIYGDQLRIPEGKVYKYEINGERVSSYSSMFDDITTGPDILEVKKEDSPKIIYIGLFSVKKLDFIEIGGRFGKRYPAASLPKEIRAEVQKKYEFYLEEIKKQKK